jgi:hypothetical protein
MEQPMPHNHNKVVSGKISQIFGHRFVLKTLHGEVLADLTPKGIEMIALRVNDDVTLEGEMKPSELKVTRLTRDGNTIKIEHKKKQHDNHHPHADSSVAMASVRTAGFEILGSPRRKPKHFEVLGRRKGEFCELHVELDGHIRKSELVARDDQKWSSELAG